MRLPARLRRPCACVAIVGAVYWAVTGLCLDITYYGQGVTVALKRGYFAMYWGEPEEVRNTRVLNNFAWPDFPGRGAGVEWTADRWGRWNVYGPSWSTLNHRWIYPRNVGLFLPGAGREYFGLPAWIVVCVGVLGYRSCGPRLEPRDHSRRRGGLAPPLERSISPERQIV